MKEKLGYNLKPGDKHYRAFVGPSNRFDVIGAMKFNLLTFLGLREHHFLLDIGCGSLPAGRLFIPYLLPGGYFGVEPERWLVEEGIENELGKDLITIKNPQIVYNSEFNFKNFKTQFDFVIAQSIFSHASSEQKGVMAATVDQIAEVIFKQGAKRSYKWSLEKAHKLKEAAERDPFIRNFF